MPGGYTALDIWSEAGSQYAELLCRRILPIPQLGIGKFACERWGNGHY